MDFKEGGGVRPPLLCLVILGPCWAGSWMLGFGSKVWRLAAGWLALGVGCGASPSVRSILILVTFGWRYSLLLFSKGFLLFFINTPSQICLDRGSLCLVAILMSNILRSTWLLWWMEECLNSGLLGSLFRNFGTCPTLLTLIPLLVSP